MEKIAVVEDINEVPDNLRKEICKFLFEANECPVKELEKYVVRFYELRTKRGDRNWAQVEKDYFQTVRLNLLYLTKIKKKQYEHAGLIWSCQQALEGALGIIEILIKEHDEIISILGDDVI
jgi:hypothetical protein